MERYIYIYIHYLLHREQLHVSALSNDHLQVVYETLSKLALGSCDRASLAKYEDRKTNKMQQLDVYY